VLWPTVVAAGALAAVYAALRLGLDDPAARVWLAAPLFGPGTVALLWAQRVFTTLVRLARTDPLAETTR
jgi:hypothetical protein